MDINKCEKCGRKFEYKSLLKPVGGFTDPLLCNNCGAPHQPTLISRIALSALVMLPVFFGGVRRLGSNIFIGILVYLVYLAIIKAISPYILRYKFNDHKEEI